MGTRQAGAELNRFAQSLFRALPAKYDTLANLLSFGQDRRWRAAVVERIAASNPGRVLDVACGPAGVTLAIARAVPAARIVGVDLTEPMLRQGVANAAASGLGERIAFALARGEQLPFADDTFDAISFSYLMRYVDDPAATIAELARCLRPGGTIACLEFHVPGWRPARAVWGCYTRGLLPLLGFALGGRAWFRVGKFLGPSISNFYSRHPVASQVVDWQTASLRDVGVRRMSFGGGIVVWATKRP
jgi:demethylmenaquinone methyltransferase/2-methoxy-6-polyprenyl-1,4-benzoquinol methylase